MYSIRTYKSLRPEMPVLIRVICCFQFDFSFFDWSKSKSSSSLFQTRRTRQEVFLDIFVRFLRSIWGVCLTGRGVFHETKANDADFCRVDDCFRGEIHQSREAWPPERPQPEARRPLAQSRPPTAPQNNSSRRKLSFSSLVASQTTRAPTR